MERSLHDLDYCLRRARYWSGRTKSIYYVLGPEEPGDSFSIVKASYYAEQPSEAWPPIVASAYYKGFVF